MNDSDRQLVEAIAQQVIELLRRRGMLGPDSSAGAADSGGPRAEVRPPIGVCTGDYSKFPELAGRSLGAPPPMASSSVPAPPASSSSAPPTYQVVPITGIVTANQLQAAMAAAPDGVAVLACDARLTPLAADLAREKPQGVCRASSGTVAAPAGSPAPAALPLLWWADGPNAAVRQIVEQRRDRLRSSTTGANPSATAQVVRDLAAAIKARQVAGGLLFVNHAAQAMCYANRCLSIRAVLGTCDEAVEQGLGELGANVLVLEYPFVGQRAMAAMVDRFMHAPPTVPPSVERMLAELHRCG